MLTLSNVKAELGITVADHDTDLTRMIRQTVSRIRQRTQRKICWQIQSITDTGTVYLINSIGHGLQTGETVKIQNSDCAPVIDGDHVITRVDADNFSVPQSAGALTSSGSSGSAHPLWAFEFASMNQRFLWIPQIYMPLITVSQVEVRTALETWEIVDATDYERSSEDSEAKAMALVALDDYWPVTRSYPRYQYALSRTSNLNNVRVTAYVGTYFTPDEIQMAGHSMVADLFERQGGPKDIAGTSFEGVSVNKLAGVERKEGIWSPESVLMSWRAR